MKEYAMKPPPGIHDRILVTEEFVERNKLKITEDQDGIVNKIQSDNTLFGFSSEVLVQYLDYAHARPFIRDDVKADEWEKMRITDVYEAAQDMLDYLIFGYMKAIDQRGLSAGRTVGKLNAWLWVLDRKDLATIIEDEDNYNPYGAPALILITEALGLPVPEDLKDFAAVKCH